MLMIYSRRLCPLLRTQGLFSDCQTFNVDWCALVGVVWEDIEAELLRTVVVSQTQITRAELLVLPAR
jgi:hypothetical protein